MAKNLKLNVKNAQLAEALKLNHLSKAPSKKKKEIESAAATEPSEATATTAPIESTPLEKAFGTTFEAAPPPITEKTIPLAVESSPSAVVQEPEKEKLIDKQQTAPVKEDTLLKRPSLPSQLEEPPAYETTSHPSLSNQARPYQRPPHREENQSSYRGEERRAYPPREGNERRPYSPREGEERRAYPPREGNERRPYPSREGAERRSYPPRNTAERRPYAPHEGGERRAYPPRERPYTPREGGERKPYPPRPGSKPEYKRPFTPRPEGHPEFKRAFPSKSDSEPRRAPPLKEGTSSKKTARTVGHREEEGEKNLANKDFRDYKAQRKQQQTDRTFDSRDRQGLRDELEDQIWRKKRAQKPRVVVQEEVIRPKNLKVRIPISVKDLAAEMKLKSSQLITNLFMKGVVLTLNDFLDDVTTIQLLGHDFDCEITIDTTEEERVRITDKTIKQEIQESPSEMLIIRPPVIAFMGHVDHGKTSLIDAIRKTNLAATEAGSITQHIGAFKCHTNVGDITILDTPGHEAFSAMRTRGADVTDIVVLVIAGDEGMRTQTIEALEQAKAAHVPILVAINKCDKPNFNPDSVYRELAEHELLPEAWGGQTITVNCSAISGEGIQNLVEMLALQAEVLELKANPHARARGTVIESEMHKGLGPVATVLVQNGTLHLGDALVFSQNHARVKTMHDEMGRELTQALPSTPVKITGLSGLPEAGSEFIVVKDERQARELAEKRIEGKRFQMMQQPKRATTESFLQESARTTPKKTLNLILRADVQGSVEALKTSLAKIPTDKVELNIISAAVGEVSESDVQLAQTSKAIIIGFHTQIESHAASLIKELKVTVKLHDVIYHAVDDVKVHMTNLLDKIAQENETGSALVKATFKASQLGVIAGCIVTEGTIKRSCHIRVMRNEAMIWKGPMASLKKVKEDVREVSKGLECGILLQNFNDVKVGDILQAFEINYLKQEL